MLKGNTFKQDDLHRKIIQTVDASIMTDAQIQNGMVIFRLFCHNYLIAYTSERKLHMSPINDYQYLISSLDGKPITLHCAIIIMITTVL